MHAVCGALHPRDAWVVSLASLEQGSRAGGVWVYTEETEEGGEHAEAQQQQQQQQQRGVHSSMYRNLRTNLPREVMSYADFPFTRVWHDPRRFCGHAEVCCPEPCRVVTLYKLGLLCPMSAGVLPARCMHACMTCQAMLRASTKYGQV